MNLRNSITLTFATLTLVCGPDMAAAMPPNIILIVADDLGYADVACQGNSRVSTPHIDRLARQGMRFTDFHSNGPMCSPTRAALLTGLYQQRLGIETALDLMKFPAARDGLPAGTVTIAQTLKDAGYRTAAFGKWHLGHHPDENPVEFGFEEFRGLMCGDGDFVSRVNRLGLPDWWHDRKLAPDPSAASSTTLVTDHAVRFITENKDRSFFLYLPHLAIHFPWMGPGEPAHRKAGKKYLGVAKPANSKLGPHVGSQKVRDVVGAMISDLDASVGRVMETLRTLDLDERTLVVFTSDNGGYTDYEGLHRGEISDNGPLRGGKGSLYEGGHRVPTLIRWTGRIPAGKVSDETAMSFDLAPTFLELADLPPAGKCDGLSLVSLLLKGAPLPDRTLFWRMKKTAAVRQGPWKLVRSADDSLELFHLGDDIGEKTDLHASNPELTASMLSRLKSWEQSVDP